MIAPRPHTFDGATFETLFDQPRLSSQYDKVFAVASDGQWHTLHELSELTGAPEGSVSARLRDCRKARFGGHTVERRPRGDRSSGAWEYRVIVSATSPSPAQLAATKRAELGFATSSTVNTGATHV